MPDLDKLLGDIAANAGGGRGLLPGSSLRVRAAQRRRRHAIATGVAASLVAVVAVVGIQVARSSSTTPPVSAAASDAASAVAESGTGSQSGYVDFVELNGVSYLSTAQFLTDQSFVGAHLGAVRRATTQAAPSGEAVAAFLPVGAEIATFTGYRPAFRILGRSQQGWKVYEADPTGGKGADILDILGRVTRIDILSYDSHGAFVRGSITDSSTVTGLVDGLMASRVIGSDGATPTSYVAFAMTDGTRVIRPYNAASHRLGGIEVPPAVAEALGAASH